MIETTGIYTGQLTDEQYLAAGRLAGLRELMKMEMPDRWSDIAGVRLDSLSASDLPIRFHRNRRFLEKEPALWNVYARALNRALASDASIEDVLANQGAECLYLVIMHATGDGEARGLFKETDAADTDGDGALELLDGWGNPISYLRWAPGFESDAQLSVTGLQDIYRDAERDTNDNNLNGAEAVLNAILDDHCPYDLFRIDNPFEIGLTSFNETTDNPAARGWRLVPLIYSIGPDEESGLVDGLDTSGASAFETLLTLADPYMRDRDAQRLGALDPDNLEAASDNIHNHQGGSLVRTR